WIQMLVERWQAVGGSMGNALIAAAPITDAEVRRWVASVGRLHLPGYFRLAGARWAVRRRVTPSAPSPQAIRALYRRALRAAFRDPVDLRDLALDGDDLRRAGIPAGPALGKILQALLDWVLDDPARNTPSALLARADELRAAARSEGP
ncbi:MAG: hypothetical protein WBQ26_15425, partial [Gemmatimonadaceae bacterium]